MVAKPSTPANHRRPFLVHIRLVTMARLSLEALAMAIDQSHPQGLMIWPEHVNWLVSVAQIILGVYITMRRFMRVALSLLMLASTGTALAENPKVSLQTNKGVIIVELYADQAPKSVANFLAYVDSGFYDGTIFHRVIKDFMIQGGGFTPDMKQKTTKAPIPNEADNGLKNDRGTLAMARTSDPNSATAQFFINHKDNVFLNYTAKTPRGWGYAVFGKVTDGLEVVDAIAAVPTGAQGPFPKDVPQETIIIEKASRVGG